MTLLAAAALVSGGCDKDDTGSFDVDTQGNLDTPSAAGCEDTSPMIDGLSSGWAKNGEGRWTLRLTSLPEDFDWERATTCPDYGWEILLDLPMSTLAVGEYDLQADLSGQAGFEVGAVWNDGDGCLVSRRGGTPDGTPIPGTLVISSVSDACVTGYMIGVNAVENSIPPVEFDGGFQALVGE